MGRSGLTVRPRRLARVRYPAPVPSTDRDAIPPSRATAGGRRRDWLGVAIVVALVVAISVPALDAPWYFDDVPNIVEYPGVRDLRGSLASAATPRGVARLTFALNYRVGELDVRGYRLVNVALHALAGVLVLRLATRVFPSSTLLPIATAAIFVAHPLQTQAVTYVVQRMAGLAAALSLLSLWLYVRAREARQAGARFTSPRHLARYCLAIAAGVLALYAKETAAVLPLALLVFDRCFVTRRGERLPSQIAYVAPWFFASAFVAVQIVVMPLVGGTALDAVGNSETRGGILAYVLTQAEVFWLYLRLAVAPVGQALHYDEALTGSLTSVRTLASLAGIVALAVAAMAARARHPQLSFAVAWFMLGLAVESTIIVLDPVFEHRVYVPLLGVAVATVHLVGGLPSRMRVVVLSVIVVTLSGLAVVRNHLWADPIAFYEDNLRRAPDEPRVLVTLAGLYRSAGRAGESRVLLARAVPVLERKVARDPDNVKALTQLASALDTVGRPREAIAYLEAAIARRPGYDRAYADLGAVHAGLGEWTTAEHYHRRALALAPYAGTEHYNLGVALYRQGRRRESLTAFETAARLSPFDPDPLYNLGIVLAEERRIAEARQLLPRLARLNPRLADALRAALDPS